MRFLILHGPNLNRLGYREPAVYGTQTLSQLDESIRVYSASLGVETRHLQSNHEGGLIDALHAADADCDGVVINPGAYTHYSYALRDGIASIRPPCVEVHLSDIHAREAWRRVSVVSEVCVAQIVGRGAQGYLDAVSLLVDRLKGKP